MTAISPQGISQLGPALVAPTITNVGVVANAEQLLKMGKDATNQSSNYYRCKPSATPNSYTSNRPQRKP